MLALVAVDADDRRDIEIECVEFVDEFLNRRRRPHLAVARADVIGFNQQLFAGQINDDKIVGVGGWQRIHFDAARAVGQYSRAAAETSKTKALLFRSRLSGFRVCGAWATLA